MDINFTVGIKIINSMSNSLAIRYSNLTNTYKYYKLGKSLLGNFSVKDECPFNYNNYHNNNTMLLVNALWKYSSEILYGVETTKFSPVPINRYISTYMIEKFSI